MTYSLAMMIAAGFLGWSALHTDEDIVILGLFLVLGAALGMAFPKHRRMSPVVLAAAVVGAETAANFGYVHAVWPLHGGLAWQPAVGLVPAMTGSLGGAAVRRIIVHR